MILQIQAAHQGKTIREVLLSFHLGKSTIYKLEEAGAIFINGSPAKGNDALKVKDELLILFENIDEQAHEPIYEKINILYEDQDYLLVQKPRGILTHSDGKEISLSNYVAAYFALSPIVARACHRLDFETTGMILFSKHLLAHAIMTNLFENHSITKEYVALCHGKFDNPQGIINAPIGRNRHNDAQIVSKTGKSAVTEYHVLSFEKGVSRVRVKIEGGRRHQIRVHLASIDHPIVGDTLYGSTANEPMKLHFEKIEFIHPFTGKLFTHYLPPSW
ncbi:MAG: RluA family pseudouridine synthase [Bacilli bacterium]|nr:RluA family pseudouridine synthase [Bacilli bacterium]